MTFTRFILCPMLILLVAVLVSLPSIQYITAQEDDDSPRMITFVIDKQDNQHCILVFDGEGTQAIPAFMEGDILNTSFSPDGQKFIAIRRTTQGATTTLYNVQADTWQDLACVGMRWSPDSRSLALGCDIEESFGYIPYPAYIFDTQTQNLHPITEDVGGSFLWRWTPDSRFVGAFLSLNSTLAFFAVDEAGITPVIEVPGPIIDMRDAPDGGLVYANGERLYRVDLVAQTITLFLEDGLLGYVWSPDGTRVVVTLGDGGVWAETLSTGERYLLNGDKALPDTGSLTVSWSPDSSFVLLSGTTVNRELVQFVVRADGTDTHVFSADEGRILWGKSGTWLTYHRGGLDSAGTYQSETIVAEIADDGTLREHLQVDGGVLWSPDGSVAAVLIHNADAGVRQLMLWSPGWDEPRQLLNSHYNVISFAFVEDAP